MGLHCADKEGQNIRDYKNITILQPVRSGGMEYIMFCGSGFGGGQCWWIIIIILILCCCCGGNNFGGGFGGCGCDRGGCC